MTWTILAAWIIFPLDNSYLGKFQTQQQCLTYLKSHSPNFEIEPAILQCVQIKTSHLEHYK